MLSQINGSSRCSKRNSSGAHCSLHPLLSKPPLAAALPPPSKRLEPGSERSVPDVTAAGKTFYPKSSNQSAATKSTKTTATAAVTTESSTQQQQQQQHKTSNNIYNRKTSNSSICMNIHNYNHNTNHRNGSYNDSSKNLKTNNPNAPWPLSANICSIIYRCEQRKSIRYDGDDNDNDNENDKEDDIIVVHPGIISGTSPKKLARISSNDDEYTFKLATNRTIDYLQLFKKFIHYLFIVNCLVYVIDGNLSMTKIGAFGAITSNYSIVPSATIAPILMPTMSINRSSDPTAIASASAKNRKIGNSIRIDSDDGTEDNIHSLPLAELKQQAQQHQQQQQQHHYNHEQYVISPSASSHHFQKMASQHQSPHSAHHAHSSGAHSAHTGKHSASKHHQLAPAAAIDSFEQTTIPSSDSNGSGANNGGASEEFVGGCTSCQIREQLKAQNLASIKMHILARLAMSQPPNITTRPPISEHLIQSFYSQNGFRYIRVKNNYHNDDNENDNDNDQDMNDMLGDDPSAYHDESSVSVVAEHSHGIKDIPLQSEHHAQHAQHHHHDVQQHHHNRHTNINNIKKFDDTENVSHKYYNADNEYNDEFDAFDERGGIVYNPDYYDEVPPEFDDDADEAFYSITDSIYSYPKRKYKKKKISKKERTYTHLQRTSACIASANVHNFNNNNNF